jgi:hypothetical protein
MRFNIFACYSWKMALNAVMGLHFDKKWDWKKIRDIGEKILVTKTQ